MRPLRFPRNPVTSVNAVPIWTEKPCRFPEHMHPCLESYGVVVSEIVEKEAMEYNLGGNTILWFSMVLIRR